MSISKLPIYLILFLILITSISAFLQSLLNSYNYDFYNGTINVTSQNDYMIDKNLNYKNDTLIINITADATSGNYKFIAEIIDENGILINNTQKTISASDFSAAINFPSELLSKQKFNYSIRINDNENNLVFRKSNIESHAYSDYETGTNITKITDENVNNNFIRINLTIDSPEAKNANITITLAYNSSTISKREEKSITNGIQIISINFGNETIKSAHYNGNFTINYIIIGNKMFDFSQNTSAYDFRDFAKTSYIESISDGRIDLNNNNLSDFLEINFTVEVKEENNYTVSYELHDQFNNFAVNKSKTENLPIGAQNIRALVNGSEIYKTKISGPYLVSFAKLSVGNDAKDIVFNSHTTSEIFYTDFEKPSLPDLKLAMNAVFNNAKKTANITVNLSNIGNAPAFNIFLDIFSNKTYQNNRTLAFLDKNNFIVYNFNAENSSNDTLFTAIADFGNLVDESNEENNIINSLTEEKNDFDNDGIDDGLDTLIGDKNSVNTTINNLTIKIGDNTDLSTAFNGTHKIKFIENESPIMEFDYNLSKILNLTKIMFEKQSNNSFGYFIVRGVKLNGTTKAVYVDRTDTVINGVCIKDAEIISISQISSGCNGINEVKIECDGTLQNSYICSYNTTTIKYKISGLNNSGIRQIDYAKQSESSSADSGSSGRGDGSAGSGSGSCLEKWSCAEWSNCVNNLQTRACSDINKCATMFNKPKEAELCAIREETTDTRLTKEYISENKDSKKPKKYSLPAITGNLLIPPKNADKGTGAFIVLAVVIAGLFAYLRFTYKAD